ncbi:UDP-N-acetylmuramate--L-alanine ligase [Chloroflexota bacterium]
MPFLQPEVRVHLVGIGGIGLSAIARVLHGRGYIVTGSDQDPTALTGALAAEGIKVHAGHRRENIPGTHQSVEGAGVVVIVSSAVPNDNPEVIEARRRGFPVVKRQEILSEITAGRTTIAVAGTHGKTTTSAMIAWILTEAGLDPTFIVGGILQNLGINARAGAGPHFVIEADEYDRAFLGLWPHVAVVTIIEHDHPDCFPEFDDMRAAFNEFAKRVEGHGQLIVCGEDREARRLAERVAKFALHNGAGTGSDHVATYGEGPIWDWQAEDVELGGSPTFEVRHMNKRLGTCALQLPGRHNVLNALAALAAAAAVGVDFDMAAAALTRFRGTARRFEVKGQAAGVTVVDDYAHHPTEIRATLEAARLKYPGRAIWAVFQPHTYSRTAALLDDFAAAFGDADHVLVTDIYAAREKNTFGVSGTDVVARMVSASDSAGPSEHAVLGGEVERRPDAQYVHSFDAAVAVLLERVGPGDVIMTLGAGDGNQIGERVLDSLRDRESGESPGNGTSGQHQIACWECP